MPPRIQLPLGASTASASSSTAISISTFLLPFLQLRPQTRSASILTSLSDTPGAYNRKIRRGRGPSSGKGKTSGRGHKGQKQHGKVPRGFQGGQTSLDMEHGKAGFKNIHATYMSPINLDRIQDWINQGRLDPSQPITLKQLTRTRAIHGIKDGIKLLARGSTALTTPVHLVVSKASQQAIAAVEALGGTVTTRFYTKTSIGRIRQDLTDSMVSLRWDPEAMGNPHLGPTIPREDIVKNSPYEYRLPDPTDRKELEYYRDPKHRGYLAHTVKEGEFPSLYWKPQSLEKRVPGAEELGKKKALEENRVW